MCGVSMWKIDRDKTHLHIGFGSGGKRFDSKANLMTLSDLLRWELIRVIVLEKRGNGLELLVQQEDKFQR